jgi:polyphosphate kinase 2 (PPK2 family)
MEHLNPRGAGIVALEKPTEREQTQWYFQRYVQHLPARGRWCCSTVLVQPRRCRAGDGFCTQDEYEEFLRQAPEYERMLVRSGILLIKLWFSVSQAEQQTAFSIRQIDPVRQWKLSPTDLASLDKWVTTPRPRRRCSYTRTRRTRPGPW